MEDDKKVTHFFKIKFDEPYLMFREWRECTKSIIAKRPIRKHKFGLTAKYALWAQAKFRQKPHLFKNFNDGKGIIALRNMFLQEVEGITNFIGAEVIALCKIPLVVQEGELEKGREKTLLIPIATIASGKTTLARCLTIMYPDLIGHIQNDNIQAKKAAPIFEQNIMETFITHDIVFADRNNHLFQHREGLCSVFKAEYPAGKIIALDWNIQSLDKKIVMDLTASRIELRYSFLDWLIFFL
jgi:tRNA ligase